MTTLVERKLETEREERIPITPPLSQPTQTSRNAPLQPPYEQDMVRFLGPRVCWGGIISGLTVGFGSLLLLVTFGLAVGFSITDQPWWISTKAANAVGTKAAASVAITILLTYFVAGMVSAKASNRPDRGGTVLQGTIVWVLFSSFVCVLVTVALGSELVRDATNAGVVTNSENLSADFLPEGGYTGNLDLEDSHQLTMRLADPQVPGMVAEMTGISQEEAEKAIADLQGRIALVRDDPIAIEETIRNFLSRMNERARQKATEASAIVLRNVRVGAWVTFAMLAVTLLVSILGALTGMPSQEAWHRFLVRSRLHSTAERVP